MDNNIKKKSILMAIVIFMIGLLITGGTYAYLTTAVTVTNGNYVTNTHCFGVTYQNDDTSITGTLFPSGDAYGGITDWVSATADSTCGLTGKGTLKIHVNSASTVLTGTVAAHCENENTLETQKSYTTQSACTAVTGNKWVTDGTALKYAVFSGNDLYSSGYIKSTDIGNDIIVHDNFSVTTTSKKFDVYVWLDGYLSNENYYDLDFSASSNMVVRQAKSTETYPGDTPLVDDYLINLEEIHPEITFNRLFQRVEYIQSTGTQYIDTGITPNATTDIEVTFMNDGTNITWQRLYGQSSSAGNKRYQIEMNNGTSTSWVVEIGGASNTITLDATSDFQTIKFVSGQGIYVNGILTVSTTTTEVNSYNIWLFRGYDKYSSLKISSAKLWQNGVLVRDFVPFYRKNENKPGLYDLVNGVFYTNAATSGNDFTFGPDVN